MIQVHSEVVDRDELIRRVRQELLQSQPGSGPRSAPEPKRWTAPPTPLEPLLAPARQNAAVGAAVPPMRRLPWALRPLARLVGWVVLRPLQMITGPQRSCNQALIETIDVLARRVQELEGVVSHLDGRSQAMQAGVLEAQLHCREMGTLQSKFDFLDGWTRQTLAEVAASMPAPARGEGRRTGLDLSVADEETWEGV